MKCKFFVFAIIVAVQTLPVQAQQKIGEWSALWSFAQLQDWSVGENTVWGVANSAAFYYSPETKLQFLSKVNGLSDVDMQKVLFSSENKTAIITYKKGNIDLFFENKIFTIKSVTEKRPTTTTYNAIITRQSLAYLATNFGVLTLDLQAREIKETMFLGESGEEIPVYDICLNTAKTALFAATPRGVLLGQLDGRNLMDYANWEVLSPTVFSNLESTSDKVYGITQNNSSSIFEYKASSWELIHSFTSAIDELKAINSTFYVHSGATIYRLSENGLPENIANEITAAAVLENNETVHILPNQLTVGDTEYLLGLPITEHVKNITAYNNTVWLAGNGFATHNINEEWERSSTSDFVKVIQQNTEKAILLAADGNLYEKNNSDILPLATGNYTDIQLTDDGQVWATNNSSNQQLSVLPATGELQSYSIKGIASLALQDLIVLPNNDKWAVANRSIYAFNETSETQNSISFAAYDQEGQLLSNNIKCLAQDNNQTLWCGTGNGILVFSNPQSALLGKGIPTAFRVVVGNSEEANYLLKDNTIQDIIIDGGNRKWIATENAGLFLVSESGDQIIENFTISNSPLPSNTVNQLAINQSNGNLYITTNKGSVVYKTKATAGARSFGQAYVYPNPVRPNYTGQICITGLMEGTELKITDTAGNLVFESESTGGQVLWNGKNGQGRRVATGVYFIFVVAQEGQQKHVLKLLFIN